MSRELEARLREEIETLIANKFRALEPKRLALVLEQMSVDYEERARAEKSQPPKQGARTAFSTFDGLPSDVFLEISVVAEDEIQVANLLHQIVSVGALMMQVDQPVKLNEFVTLVVEYEPLSFSMQITGRVVNISTRGTAIEVMKLEREDRVALESLYLDYQHLVGADASTASKPVVEEERSPQRAAVAEKKSASSPSVSAGSGTPMARLGSTLDGARFTLRRQVAITNPDIQVLNTSSQADAEAREDPSQSQEGQEYYGPLVHWIEPQGDPDRIEELSGERIIDILLQLCGHSFSGMLRLQHPGEDGEEAIKWQLLFDSGFLVEASRTPRSPRIELGHMLLLAGRIKKDNLVIAAAHGDEHGLPLERSLLELDLLSPDALRQSLAGRLTFLLRRLCNTNEGTVEIYGEERMPTGYLPAPPLRVHVAIERTIFQILFENLRQLSVREREKQADAELDSYPESGAEDVERVERALINEEHMKFVRRLANGRKRLREVITESALSGADTFAVLFSLHRMGLLRFDRSLHHTVVRERFRENVTVKFLSVHKASYFEVLNVHWSSYDEVIHKAYKELIEQFDPAKVPENLEREVHQRVADIRERVDSAYQVLARREHRHAYRTRIMPEYKLAHAVPLFLKQCELAERRNQWEEARDSLKRALEIDPTHHNARAMLDGIERRLAGNLAEDSSSAPV